MLGNGRLEAFCFDGVNRLCHIRGKLRKRVWIGVGDIILLGLREFQDQKVRALGHPPRPQAVHATAACLNYPSVDLPHKYAFAQADIILKYDGDEARSLKTYGELPDTVQINAGTETLEGEEFGDDSASPSHPCFLIKSHLAELLCLCGVRVADFDFDEDADGAEPDDIVRRLPTLATLPSSTHIAFSSTKHQISHTRLTSPPLPSAQDDI